MKTIEYLKLQAKNLHRDFKTQKTYLDTMSGDNYYDYEPKFFDINAILIGFDIDQDNFKLMNAQHIIAQLVGFEKWTALLDATPVAQELSKLLFDNMHKICIEEWVDYIARAEYDNGVEFDDDTRLDIFKMVFVNVDGHQSFKTDYRLFQNEKKSEENQIIKREKREAGVKIFALPLVGVNRKKFIKTANLVFEDVLDRIEPKNPHQVRELWDPEKYIDKILLRPDMLPIDREYALSLIDAFLVHHVIELAVETDN